MRLYRFNHRAHPAIPNGPSLSRQGLLLEPCRRILRHFRQESGHYYWQTLVADDPARLLSCREQFGDERRDYARALRAHYHDGPPADWQSYYVSPYASAHPWEDFSETWACYLRLVALVADTEAARPLAGLAEREALAFACTATPDEGFLALLRRWLPASLRADRNRRPAPESAYARETPFSLTPPPVVIDKMAWIHRLMQDSLASVQRPRLA